MKKFFLAKVIQKLIYKINMIFILITAILAADEKTGIPSDGNKWTLAEGDFSVNLAGIVNKIKLTNAINQFIWLI